MEPKATALGDAVYATYHDRAGVLELYVDWGDGKKRQIIYLHPSALKKFERYTNKLKTGEG